jgi:hypothetical protein
MNVQKSASGTRGERIYSLRWLPLINVDGFEPGCRGSWRSIELDGIPADARRSQPAPPVDPK